MWFYLFIYLLKSNQKSSKKQPKLDFYITPTSNINKFILLETIYETQKKISTFYKLWRLVPDNVYTPPQKPWKEIHRGGVGGMYEA